MNFGSAIDAVQTATLSNKPNSNPKGFRLPQWPLDMVVRVHKPTTVSDMSVPYFYVERGVISRAPWIPTMIEMFALNWELVP